MTKISHMLWYDTEAEEAAQLYTSLIPGSRVTDIRRYGDAMPERSGEVMTVAFELDGAPHVALNGGPGREYNETMSIVVTCADQAEVDRCWEGLLAGGGEEIACGWLKDRWGVHWQIVPERLWELQCDPDPERGQRAFAAMMGMKRLDIAALEAAADG